MVRTVNVKLIRSWVDAHSPMGAEKLAVAASVSFSLVNQILGGRKVPSFPHHRRSLAAAVGVAEEILFPQVDPSQAESA